MKEVVFVKPLHTEIQREEDSDRIKYIISNASDEFTYKVAFWRGFTSALFMSSVSLIIFVLFYYFTNEWKK